MKTRTTMKSTMCILLAVGMLLFSCKKKDDPTPGPTANTDNVSMGTTGSITTINVLDNDSYQGNAIVEVLNDYKYGTLVVNTDKTITFTARANFYGTATLKYTLQDANGTTTGNISITRGNANQIKTAEIINMYVSNIKIYLYAINGDSSRTYQPNYTYYNIDYQLFNQDKLTIFSNDVIIPEIGHNTYTITSDGSIYTLANGTNNPVILEVVGAFTKSVKKRDGSGQYMTVSGYTLKYGTDVLDFTTLID